MAQSVGAAYDDAVNGPDRLDVTPKLPIRVSMSIYSISYLDKLR